MREAFFPGRIIYCTKGAEIKLHSRQLLERAEISGELVLGFDTEWPFENEKYNRSKTSLIQLCPDDDDCYLFYVYKLKELPTSLKMLLECDKVRFTGMDLAKDINKLSVSFGLNLTMSHRWIELDTLAKKKGITRPNLWGLKTLSKELLNLDVNKDETLSDWTKEIMTMDQKQYAATDAYVSLLLYQELQKISSQQPVVQLDSYEREPRTHYQQASRTENTESEGWGGPLLAVGVGAVAGVVNAAQ